MKIIYEFKPPWGFTIKIPFPKDSAFENAMTTMDNNQMFNRIEHEFTTHSVYEFPLTAARTVSSVLYHIGLEVDTSNLGSSVGKPVYEDIGQLYLRDEQYQFIRWVEKFWSGSITLEMGFGKGTMITYLCKASLFRGNNIVICAPTYSIVEELKLRLDRYEVNASMEFDPNARIWVINPVGFMARNSKDEHREWFEKVDMLITDEADSVTTSLETLIKDYLPNCRYFLGFSATPDKKMGNRFDKIISMNSFDLAAARVLMYFGPSIVYRPPTKKIRFVETPLFTGDYNNLWSYDKCVMKVTKSKVMPYYIKMCIEDNNKDGRSTILIPFTNHEQIMHFMDCEVLKPYHLIVWTAAGVTHNNGEPFEKGAGLVRVKELVNNHEVDAVFCTSVAFKGVDITELKSVMFLTCSSYGIVTQILGRIFRYKGKGLPTVYFPENTSSNPLYNKAQRTRKEYILKNEHTLEIKTLPYTFMRS